MSRIRVLSDHLINQIAAGEVIERPASVLKELLENALDAGARSIVVDVDGGGRRRIRVADDGEGMDRDDAILALERHATSKIAEGGDLGRIATLGFRGEALPAIASVSRLSILSSRDGVSATRIDVEGGRIRSVAAAGHPRGTTLDVRDLFFNTPARAKFLRAPSTELGHISELAASYAVTIPDVAVRLSHEGRRLLEAGPAAGTGERIVQVFGEEWSGAIRFESSRGPVKVRGLVAPNRQGAATRRAQHVYVNGRLVRDRVIAHAIAAACEGFLPKGRYAGVFAFLECPPEAVDVNVHPAKAEVRFADSRAVHDLVEEAIRTVLRAAMPVTQLPPPPSGQPAAAAHGKAVHEAVRAYTIAAAGGARAMPWTGGAGRVIQPAQAASRLRVEAPGASEQLGDGPVAVGHYLESYLIATDGDGLLLVDQHAAHERILFDRLARSDRPEESERQSLMFPLTVPLPGRLAPRADAIAEELNRLGFTAEPFGGAGLIVREVPALLGGADPSRLVGDLLDQLAEGRDAAETTPGRRREKLLATIACHAAIKVRMPLTPEKMNFLIKELFRTESPLTCPHGRPAVLRFTQEAIERGFQRR